MEVHFSSEVQAKLDQLALDTGCPAEELLQDAVMAYFDELAETRQMLDRRYDELASGRVKLISGDEMKKRLRERSAARRAERR